MGCSRELGCVISSLPLKAALDVGLTLCLQQWVSDMQLLMCMRGKQNLEKTQKSVTCNVLTWPRRPHEQQHMDTLMHASHTSLIDVFCHKRAVCDGRLAGEVGSVRCLLAFCPSGYSHLLSSTNSSISLHLDLGGSVHYYTLCSFTAAEHRGFLEKTVK